MDHNSLHATITVFGFIIKWQLCLLLLACLVLSMPGGKCPGFRQNDPGANPNHQVAIAAPTSWTRITAEVQESHFIQRIVLSAYQSETIDLPLSVRTSSHYSSHIFDVNSTWPVTVLASSCFCAICYYTFLHDASSWGTHYYLILPRLCKQIAVSQMVITGSEDETSVERFPSGEVLFGGNVDPEGSFLELHMGAPQCFPPE